MFGAQKCTYKIKRRRKIIVKVFSNRLWYSAMVAMLDDVVGNVTSALKATGMFFLCKITFRSVCAFFWLVHSKFIQWTFFAYINFFWESFSDSFGIMIPISPLPINASVSVGYCKKRRKVLLYPKRRERKEREGRQTKNTRSRNQEGASAKHSFSKWLYNKQWHNNS